MRELPCHGWISSRVWGLVVHNSKTQSTPLLGGTWWIWTPVTHRVSKLGTIHWHQLLLPPFFYFFQCSSHLWITSLVSYLYANTFSGPAVLVVLEVRGTPSPTLLSTSSTRFSGPRRKKPYFLMCYTFPAPGPGLAFRCPKYQLNLLNKSCEIFKGRQSTLN